MISNDLAATAAVFIEHVSDHRLIEQSDMVTVRTDGEDLDAPVIAVCLPQSA